jgi:HAD superfamily hydrolase (TIGR01509 family)
MITTAVIFDVDGTLLDSVDLHARAWVDAFNHFGFDIPFPAVRRQIGKGGDHLLAALLPAVDIEAKGKELDAYRGRLFKARYLRDVRPFPNVRELLLRLVANGTVVALGSSAKGDELETYKRIANISDLIAEETSSNDAASSKPDPDIFEAALRKLNKPPSEVMVVGDTPYDAEAAVKAGMRCIGLRCGGWAEVDLRRGGCSEVYSDPADLLAQYRRSRLERTAE